MSGYAVAGLIGLLAYAISNTGVWIAVEAARDRDAHKALPGRMSLFLGAGALGYAWSGRHKVAGSPILSAFVIALRITSLFIPLSAILFLGG